MSGMKFIADFEAFVRSKPADEAYPRLNAELCALAQFGLPDLGYYNLSKFGVPEPVYDATVHTEPSTFGALADRLAKLREVQP